jgi:hypothetical protein
MRPGDLFFIFLIWYAVVRFLLETLRTGNWTFFGIPTAMLVSILTVVGSLIVLAIRHRPGAPDDRWGEPPPREEETYEVDDEDDEIVEVDDEIVEDEIVEVEDEGTSDAAGPAAAT